MKIISLRETPHINDQCDSEHKQSQGCRNNVENGINWKMKLAQFTKYVEINLKYCTRNNFTMSKTLQNLKQRNSLSQTDNKNHRHRRQIWKVQKVAEITKEKKNLPRKSYLKSTRQLLSALRAPGVLVCLISNVLVASPTLCWGGLDE